MNKESNLFFIFFNIYIGVTREVKQLKGKSCLLEIEYHGSRLYFKATQVLEVTETHITFLDKFGQQYSFRLKDIVEVNDVA